MSEPLPTLPVGPLDLLVRAALAPPEVARPAWQAWRRSYTIDETPWNEVRLLGAVAQRMDWLEPEADILPRMKGIQKFLYAQTQLCITGCMPAVQALSAAGIPVMAMKGAARVLADGRKARERLVRDLDVLVPFARAAGAFEVLQAAGWTFKAAGAWQKDWHMMDAIAHHHAWSLSDGAVELDLHHFSNSLNRLVGDDDGLWQRSGEIAWRGLPVRLPSPADAMILSIVHGLRWSREHNADWIIDACSCLDGAAIDWPLVIAESRRRQVEAIMLAGLGYIRDTLRRDIAAEVMEALAATAAPLQRRELEVYAGVAMPRTPEQNLPLFAMALQRCGRPPGPASARPEHAAVEWKAISLPQRSSLDISRFAPGAEAATFTVRLLSGHPAGTAMIGTLCIMGLIIDCRPAVARADAQGRLFHDFDFVIPRYMLARRGVSRLCLAVGLAEEPAYPPWRYRFSAVAVPDA